jgi:ABC-type branched-subunit amino acid transport system substrate-binding protein
VLLLVVAASACGASARRGGGRPPGDTHETPPPAEVTQAERVGAAAAAGRCDEARAALAELARRHPGSARLPDARVAALACVPGGGPLALDEPGARAHLGAALERGAAAAAVPLACRVSALGGGLDAGQRDALTALVDELAPRELDEAWLLCEPGAWPAPLVAFRRMALALHRGELGRARALVGEIRDPALAERAAALVDAADARAVVDAGAVGVLLPLSGPYAKIGQELRLALEAAAEGQAGVTLHFADTGGDEARAAAAVDELVDRHHVVVIVGPVGEREAGAAAARAAALGVPIALLSPLEGAADPGAGVFRLWTSAGDRARLAARAAVGRGFEAPAVLAPRDETGAAQAAAFADECARLGHAVVARGEYDPTGTDLEPDVKAFLGLDPAKNERLRKHLAAHKKDGWKTFSPDVAFDLLYVPDAAPRAALVVAFLVYFNVELRTSDQMSSVDLSEKHGGRPPSFVQLMGSSGWNHPDLALRGGGDVEWALVVDLFFAAEPQTDAAAELVQRWQDRHGRAPSAAAAQAHDAMRLVLGARAALAGAGSTPSRAGMARALAGAELDAEAGACGAARVGPAGAIERGGLLLRVDGGALGVSDVIPPPWERE